MLSIQIIYMFVFNIDILPLLEEVYWDPLPIDDLNGRGIRADNYVGGFYFS